jgi:transposase-like protein
VARELGISDGSLRKWESHLPGADPGKMAEEIRRLNQEVAYLRRQREILKQAASILAEDPQPSMQ